MELLVSSRKVNSDNSLRVSGRSLADWTPQWLQASTVGFQLPYVCGCRLSLTGDKDEKSKLKCPVLTDLPES